MKRVYPFKSPTVFARVVLKAVLLLIILNTICLAANFDPLLALMKLNTAWIDGSGRLRLVYPTDTTNGLLPLDALFAMHTIAYTPKTPDEFRIVLIGDSGVNGVFLPDNETLAGQLNQRGTYINGKHVRVYNLGFPGPNIVKESLVLNTALAYQPDLIILFITEASFFNGKLNPLDPMFVFLQMNGESLKRYTNAYDLKYWYAEHIPEEPVWHSWLSIKHQEALPAWFRSLFYPFTTYHIDWPGPQAATVPIPDKAAFFEGMYGFSQMPDENWQFLIADQELADKAGAKLLFVNEPILVGQGVNYNAVYQRSFYDKYHTAIARYMDSHRLWYADMWNVIPPRFFLDSDLHYDAAGAELLTELILETLKQSHKLADISFKPLSYHYLPLPSDSIEIPFKDMFAENGWTIGYNNNYSWMNNVTSTLDVSLKQNTSYQVFFRVVQSIQPDVLESLHLQVNGHDVFVTSHDDPSGTLYAGIIPQSVIQSAFYNTQIAFNVNRVVTPKSLGLNNDERQLGLLFDWIKFVPIVPKSLIRIEFDEPVPGSGWSVPENSTMWTTSQTATMEVILYPFQNYQVNFRVLEALKPEILDSLKLSVNGVPISLHSEKNAQGVTIFSGTIPLTAISRGPTQLTFTVDKLVTPKSLGINGDERRLGVLFDWLQLETESF